MFVGNLNAPRQIIIAGADAGMERVLGEARRQGASEAVRLRVSVPSHCGSDLRTQRLPLKMPTNFG